MQIDLLYFDGCASWKKGLENLRTALAAEGLKADIRLIRVTSDAEAVALKFPGSPTFRVDDADLWGEERLDYAMSCRVYRTPEGMRGVPNVEMLRTQLRQIIR